jgi:hypothetical protein
MPQTFIPYLIMAAALILMIRRNLRANRIRVQTLWLAPVVLVLIAAVSIGQSPPRDAVGIAILGAGVAAGVAAGWRRGKFTHITLDAETGVLTGKGSVAGLILILALFIARYAVRAWTQAHPDHSGIAVAIADAAMAMGFATLIVARLEMWLRCRKLMTARASAA